MREKRSGWNYGAALLSCGLFLAASGAAGAEGCDLRVEKPGAEGFFAGDTIDLAAEVRADGAERIPETKLCAEWTGGAGGGETIRPVPPLFPGGSARIVWRMVLPLIEAEGESLVVRLTGTAAENGIARCALFFPPNRPGETFRIETGGRAERIDLCGDLLLLEGEGGVRPRDLGGAAPLDLDVPDGREGSAGEGFFLCLRRDLVYRIGVEDGERRRLSAPAFRAFRTAVAGERILWARHCCGLPGEIIAADREGTAVHAFRLNGSLGGRIAADDRTAVWIEEGEGGRTVRIADLSAGEVRTALLPGAPLAEPGVSGGSGVCAAAGDSGAVLCLVDPGNGEATAIADCPAYSAGPWCSGERIAWAERDREGTSVLLREREGTRILRIARSVPGIETAAFSGSVFVWIDAGDPGAVRGVRVRWPGPRVPPRCAAALGFRFEGSWVSAERVRIGWCFREDPGEGSYALFRARRAAAIPESTEVARGVLAGRGPYFLDDDRIPAPGPEEDVRYWLLLERTGAVEMVGPVEVRWPERPAEAALLPDGPNPARGSVRFVLTVPPGKGEGALTLQVYDGRGRLVSRAVALRAGSGRVPVVWDGRDRSGRRAPAGIYFLRVRMGSRVFPARKVVLL